MKHSLGYYLILFVFRLKGLKKLFSQSPLNYLQLRKDDVHLMPFKAKSARQFGILSSTITEVNSAPSKNNKLVIFFHGGAFVSGPAKHHWDLVRYLSKLPNTTYWLCDYPKAPEHKIDEINRNIDAIYAEAHLRFSSIQVLGDSVGGTLALTLTQRLLSHQHTPPKQLILITPVLDASFSNPEIEKVDAVDPMLSKNGVLSAKKMASENVLDSAISPIYGNFKDFPKTILFLAEHDLTYPDQKRLIHKLEENKVTHEAILGKNMPHIWPLLPVMQEGKIARAQLLKFLME
jgi:acetyl esterase/lipase